MRISTEPSTSLPTPPPPAVRPAITNGLKVRYPKAGAFHEALRKAGDGYFERTGLARTGGKRSVAKALVFFAWAAASYGALMFAPLSWPLAIPVAISLGLAMAGIGFSVMHDGNHGASSSSRRVNRLLGFSLDLLGGSSYLWSVKHNTLHHTHTNVEHSDPDLNGQPLLRLSPAQPRRALHKYQQYYAWVLYALMPLKWHLIDDFECFVRGTIHGHAFVRPKGLERWLFFGGKAVFFAGSLVVPMFFHPVATVLAFHLLVSMTLGITLGVFFQIAHSVEEVDFVEVPAEHPVLGYEWSRLQIRTTVDFCRDSKFLTWYLGGLNFQVVHHLYPRVHHRHYRPLSENLGALCAEHGEQYRVHPTLGAALRSHFRWLKRMGEPTAT